VYLEPRAPSMHAGRAYVYFEEEPGRRAAAKLLTRDEARPIAANIIPKLNALRDKSLDWWVVAADAELVAIQVTEVCAIVVRMIVRGLPR
jgi:hypothetical protein